MSQPIAKSSTPRTVVVAGDVAIDWLAWPTQPDHSNAHALNWQQLHGTRMVPRAGGAALLARFVEATTGTLPVSYTLPPMETLGPDRYLHSLVDLRAERDKDKKSYHVVERMRGFSGPVAHQGEPRLKAATNVSVLVLDDAGNGFRDAKDSWPEALAQPDLDWIVHKMSCPLAQGPLWEKIRHNAKKLIVVISADDLRKEGINIARHLSWERTAEDFVRELASNGRLVSLVTCANLLVRFDCDGVIHHRGLSAEPPLLFFDPACVEGDFVDRTGHSMMGLASSFTAGLISGLPEANGDLERAIRLGMQASRALAVAGFPSSTDGTPDYGLDTLKSSVRNSDPAIRCIEIPSQDISRGQAVNWSILERLHGPAVFEVARRVARLGPNELARAPVAKFHNLETADRQEIESFRSISNLLYNYKSSPDQGVPLSIAVFGPPGAGKSFGVEEVSTAIIGDTKRKPLKFNLSQFTRPEELAAAFHLIRDERLSGALPLVFFDEFDVDFNDQPLGWLRFLLAPMQDGRFLENGVMHPIGSAIFVFAGGTRPSFAAFSQPLDLEEQDPRRLAFVAAKGPDFVSRLRGHVDIRGPDQVDETDRMYPIRRAILLRSLLRKHAKHLYRQVPDKKLEDLDLRIDEGVLRALLMVPRYRHGARSMEAVLLMSRLAGREEFERAALPPQSQLAMHVDAVGFLDLVRSERLPEALRETLGAKMHKHYCDFRRTNEPHADFSKDIAMHAWTELPEHLKESNRAQADDIPRKLRAIDCYMAPEVPGRPSQDISEHLELLGEMEHDRFNAERLQDQWRAGPRDPDKRTSPFLTPWNDLTQKIKDYDINAVRKLPDVLKCIGYAIYRREGS